MHAVIRKGKERFEEKGRMDDKDSQEKKISASQQFVIYGLLILNAVFSAYVLNYTPKIGAFHLAICTAFGLVLVVFSIFAAVKCISMLIKKKGKSTYHDLAIITRGLNH